MNYSGLRMTDIANGEGVRVSLFVSGCHKSCRNCFNGCAKSFTAGKPFTEVEWAKIERRVAEPHIKGLSLLGGDPFAPSNQRALVPFLHRFRERFGNAKDIWCWTGYVLETELFAPNGIGRCEATNEMLSLIDILVDGPYIDELHDLRLKFRGSSNQRILRLHPTVEDVSDGI